MTKYQQNFVVRMLEDTNLVINMNCTDPLGRSALLMAIDNENMEILELLLENKVFCGNRRVKNAWHDVFRLRPRMPFYMQSMRSMWRLLRSCWIMRRVFM